MALSMIVSGHSKSVGHTVHLIVSTVNSVCSTATVFIYMVNAWSTYEWIQWRQTLYIVMESLFYQC